MLAQVSVFPLGEGTSISKYVAEAVDEIDRSQLEYRLTAMGTILEGDWDDVMKVLKKVRERVLKMSRRIYMTVSIDERRSDRRRRIEAKVKAVEEILKKNLKK